jgi:hypothetical protein
MSPQERREIEDPNSTLHVEDYNAFMIFRLLKGAYENIEDYLCLRYGTGVIEKEQLGARGFASVVLGFDKSAMAWLGNAGLGIYWSTA